jgi:hypothetical protein
MWGPLSRIALTPVVILALALGACASPTATADADPGGIVVAMSRAELQGTTLDHLLRANWDCQQRVPGRIACAPPGIGLPPIPSLGENGRPVHNVAVFALDGTPIGSAHFIRADLYHGQICVFTGQPFVFRQLIGYYECFRTY